MIRKGNDLVGYTIVGLDGELGTIDRLYFDDETWTIRYLALKTGDWLENQMVLLSPIALGGIDTEGKRIQTTLGKEKISGGPKFDPSRPITAEYENRYYDYYAWPVYWGDAGRWGAGTYPSYLFSAGRSADVSNISGMRIGDPNLRNLKEVSSYAVVAADAPIARGIDTLIDDDTWELRYFIAKLDGQRDKQFLVSPHWISIIEWDKKEILLTVSAETVRTAPDYSPQLPLTEEYEDRIMKHYRHQENIDLLFVQSKNR
jgi:hypothetical protein